MVPSAMVIRITFPKANCQGYNSQTAVFQDVGPTLDIFDVKGLLIVEKSQKQGESGNLHFFEKCYPDDK